MQNNRLATELPITHLLATMAFGPFAATLVELFPTRIRYSSISLPFHLRNGWFGGQLPAVSFMIIAQTGNIYLGLFYPITLALISTIVGGIFFPKPKTEILMNEKYHTSFRNAYAKMGQLYFIHNP